MKYLYILILSLVALSCKKDDVDEPVPAEPVVKQYTIMYDVFTADKEEDSRHITMLLTYTDENGEQIIVDTTDATWKTTIEFESTPGKVVKLQVGTGSPQYLYDQNRAPDPVMTRVSIYVNDELKAEHEQLAWSKISHTLE